MSGLGVDDMSFVSATPHPHSLRDCLQQYAEMVTRVKQATRQLQDMKTEAHRLEAIALNTEQAHLIINNRQAETVHFGGSAVTIKCKNVRPSFTKSRITAVTRSLSQSLQGLNHELHEDVKQSLTNAIAKVTRRACAQGLVEELQVLLGNSPKFTEEEVVVVVKALQDLLGSEFEPQIVPCILYKTQP
jgi:hypothetical protein